LPLSLLVGTVVTGLFGAVFGIAAARLRGPYLAGATLALGVALPSITSHFDVFKGDQGLFVPFDPPPAALGEDFSLEHWQAWISLGAALITLFLLANLQSSAVGRHMRAVRDDEIAASLAGLSVPRTQIVAFTVSSAAAGLGGGVFAFVLQTASPGSFGLVLSLTLLSAVIIGGLGSLTGAVLGSVIVVYLGTWLVDWIDGLGLNAGWAQNLHDHLPSAAYGLLLILVMLLLPGGLAGLAHRIPRPRRHRTDPPVENSPATPHLPAPNPPPPVSTPPPGGQA
jgi:branched-chain amino acid transport system permease protein